MLGKYNDILQQTALVSEQLSATLGGGGRVPAAALLAARDQHDRWPRPPQNQLPHLLIHPALPVPNELDFYMGSFLQTSRPPEVVEVDEAVVKRLPSSQDMATDPEGALRAIFALREEHDARADRALRAVDILRDRYNWRSRPDFTLPPAVDSGNPAVGDAFLPERMSDVNQVDNHHDEGLVDATLDPDRNPSNDDTRDTSVMTDSDDKPLDPDDDLFEEVA